MGQKRFERPRFAVALVVACGVLVSFAAGAWAANDSREVTLTAVSDGAGGCTITVSPETAIISRGNNAKIKKVYWVAEPNAEFGVAGSPASRSSPVFSRIRMTTSSWHHMQKR